MKILTSNDEILFEIITCLLISITSVLNISLCLTLDIKMSSIKEQNSWAKKSKKKSKKTERNIWISLCQLHEICTFPLCLEIDFLDWNHQHFPCFLDKAKQMYKSIFNKTQSHLQSSSCKNPHMDSFLCWARKD